jgi:hypothetical protein
MQRFARLEEGGESMTGNLGAWIALAIAVCGLFAAGSNVLTCARKVGLI